MSELFEKTGNTKEGWRYKFAGLAMQGIISGDIGNKVHTTEVVIWAVDLANRLLSELEKKQ